VTPFSRWRAVEALVLRYPRVFAALGEVRDVVADPRRLRRELRHLETRLAALEREQVPDPGTRDRVLALIEYLRPFAFDGELGRFGRVGMGGYVLSNRLGGVRQALSLGISDDVSADLDLAARGLVVHGYDPTIDRFPSSDPSLTFFREGVSAESSAQMVTLDQAVDRFQNDDDLVLLCDIESHEWGVFANASDSLLRRFQQVAIEFHDLNLIGDDAWWETAEQALTNLNRTHRVIHAHASNYFPTVACGGIRVPPYVEITYLRSDLVPAAAPAAFRLSPLDSPHDRGYPETDLGALWNGYLGVAQEAAGAGRGPT
jgi:hypothetical protein